MANRKACPHCGNLLIDSLGPENAGILLILDGPSYDDIREGRLCSRKVGEALRSELARAGIQMSSCRIISLWRHGKNKECDVNYHIEAMTKELSGHNWVFLMGSEVSKLLTDHGLMEITGLEIKSQLFPKIRMFGVPNPAGLLHGDIGEMRLAMEKFIEIRSKKK